MSNPPRVLSRVSTSILKKKYADVHPDAEIYPIGKDGVDILSGRAIFEDHARALALLERALHSLEKSGWNDSSADDIRAFLTPTGPEATHDRD